MTLAITFYDGIQYHRSDFLSRDSDFIGNGVVVSSEFPFAVPTTPNMSFTIGQGRAWVDGYRISNDASPVGLVVTAADATNPRIDIVQIGHDDINNTFSLVVKRGVAAASPVEPGADAGYTKLWAIAVAANATSIIGANFTDRRTLVPLNISGAQISLGGAASTGTANSFSGNQTLNPMATSTSVNNYASYELGFARSVWSGSVAQSKTSFFQIDVTGKLIFINEAAATVWSLDQNGNETARTFTSTVAIGTAPFTVTSTTVVPNLNAQLLNGNNSAYYAAIANPTFTGVPAAPTAAANTNTTQLATTAFVVGQVATAAPLMDGAAAVGTSLLYARQDHVHASDTSRAPLASPALTGVPTAPTAAPGTNNTQLATTGYADAIAALKANLASPVFTGAPTVPTPGVGNSSLLIANTAWFMGQTATATPLMDGTAAVGTSSQWAKQDHVHASDTSRAPLASPALTGVPTAPTAAAGNNSTQLATTAYADAIAALKANLASPVFTGTVTIPALGAEMNAGSHTIGFTELDNGNSGAAITINWKNSNNQKLTVSASTTLTFTAPTNPCTMKLRLVYSGAFTVTLPTHKKQNGVALTFSSVNAAIDILSIYWDGTNYYIMNSLGWA